MSAIGCSDFGKKQHQHSYNANANPNITCGLQRFQVSFLFGD
jgi:hypothetical protein